jgi:hypothetical protein
MGDFDNNEDMERTNAIINELFNNGIITEDEKKQLLITKESLKTATDFLTLQKSLHGNEISNGLYNRKEDYLTAPLLSKEFTYCYIKSYDNRYLNYTDDGKIELTELPENNNNYVFKIHINNTNFIRVSNKDENAFLTVNKDKTVSFPTVNLDEEIKTTNNLWILSKLDEDNKYIIESRMIRNGKLNATIDEPNIITSISNHKQSIKWVFEPIPIQTNTKYKDVISPYFNKLNALILIGKRTQTITNILSTSNEIIKELQHKLDNIKSDIKSKQSKNNLLFTNYNKDNEKYNDIKEELDNINKRSLIFEDNFNLLNEKTNYDDFKNKTLYSIQFLLFIIVVGLFIINMKTIHKTMNKN